MPPQLSADQLDALQELVNIGMGAAGAALGQALGAFVELAVPGVELADRRGVATLLDAGPWADHDIEAVRQPFFGAFVGESMMLFAGHTYAHLATLPGYSSEREKSPSAPADQEMLLDLANVVIGACVNGVAESLNEFVSFAPPTRVGNRADVQDFLSRGVVAGHQGLVVDVDFKFEQRSFLSRVLVFLPEPSLHKIDQALTRLLDGLVAS